MEQCLTISASPWRPPGGWPTSSAFPAPMIPITWHLSRSFHRTQSPDADRQRANAIPLRRTDRLPFAPPAEWASVQRTAANAIHTDAVRLELYPMMNVGTGACVEADRIIAALRLVVPHRTRLVDSPVREASEGIPYSSRSCRRRRATGSMWGEGSRPRITRSGAPAYRLIIRRSSCCRPTATRAKTRWRAARRCPGSCWSAL